MSAILSADDLNDFISPGVACIKPVETLPRQAPESSNFYEVTKDGKHATENTAAQISLTDCLACSGCVTSAEAVLVSLQSHAEVLNTLDTKGKVFIASVSPQVRASLAATYGVSEHEAGWMIDQLLGGTQGLALGGLHGNHFKWIIDTNAMREASLVLGAEEVTGSLSPVAATPQTKRPILSSACPGWICYAEKTHPHVLPYLSSLKSPQALTGTLIKTVLSQRLHISPDQIWHVAIMPCFDKKLEASREEFTDIYWRSSTSDKTNPPVRDVDCVITARELLMLCETRGLSFPSLPRQPLIQPTPFPDPLLSTFLFPSTTSSQSKSRSRPQTNLAGTSGGYLHHILLSLLSQNPSSTLTITPGRNSDITTYTIISPSAPSPIFKAARYYGFRNIQNLVRKLKPPKKSRLPGARLTAASTGCEYDYVEVMACPGGCTNGGGQVKVEDVPEEVSGGRGQKEWLGLVDEAYFSGSEACDDVVGANSGGNDGRTVGDEVNGISPSYIRDILRHWESSTCIPLSKLIFTTFREVESDVGKSNGVGKGAITDDRVVESIAGKIGGGW